MLLVKCDYKRIINHYSLLFDNNVLEKVDSNTALVEVALDAVDQRS